MVGGAKAPSYIYKVRLIKIKVMLENYDFQAAQELMYNKEVKWLKHICSIIHGITRI